MKNPARLLAEILAAWESPPNEGVTTSRTQAMGDRNFWAAHRDAVVLLSEVVAIIDGFAADGDEVAHFEASIEGWTEAIFYPEGSWGAAGARVKVKDHDLRMLQSLAQFIDRTGGAPTISADQHVAIADLLAEAWDLVGTSDLPPEVRLYLRNLITEAQTVLTDAQFHSSTAVRSIMMELGGAMTTSSALPQVAARPDVRQRLLGIAFRIFAKVGINVASHGAITAFDAALVALEASGVTVALPEAPEED